MKLHLVDATRALTLAESLHTKGEGRCDNNLTNLWRRGDQYAAPRAIGFYRPQ